jgi:hypothetical protein
MSHRPAESEYAPSYAGYVGKVSDSTDILATLEQQRGQLAALPQCAAGDLETHRYAEGKWSVREVVGHLGDAERVFGYRIFCMSRGDAQSLPGFDENVYAERSGSHRRPLAELVAELLLMRDANLALLRNLDAEAWSRSGVANNKPFTVRALIHVLAGHCRHHLDILRERYGVTT